MPIETVFSCNLLLTKIANTHRALLVVGKNFWKLPVSTDPCYFIAEFVCAISRKVYSLLFYEDDRPQSYSDIGGLLLGLCFDSGEI